MWPIIIVQLLPKPSSWATRITRSQSSAVALTWPILPRGRSAKISPPPPGIVASPASLNRLMISRQSIRQNRSNSVNSGGLKAWMWTVGYSRRMNRSKSR